MGERVRKCPECGEEHSLSTMELTFKRPDSIFALSPEERRTGCKESEDLCVLRGERFFIRGVLPLPVDGRKDSYSLGVWAEVNEVAFQRIRELWKDEEQHKEPFFEATLSNHIPSHESTTGLAVLIELTGPTTRPNIWIADRSHPLYTEQQEGITSHRAYEYSSYFDKA